MNEKILIKRRVTVVDLAFDKMKSNKKFLQRTSKGSIPEIKVTLVDSSTFHDNLNKIKGSIWNYFSMSTMHGLFHLTIHGICHRICWFILFVFSLISCYFVTTNILKAREVIVLSEKSMKSTFDIPFPAITVCTTIKADHRKFKYFESNTRILFQEATEDE